LVISAQAFREFLETINWLEPLFADLPGSSLHVDVSNPRQLQAIAQQIRQAIQATPLPERWLAELEELLQSWHTPLLLRSSLSLRSGVDPAISSKTTGLLESQLCQISTASISSSLKRFWGEMFRAR